MKKIFTLTILSLMLILTIANSCSKSSDSSTTPTPTPTPTVSLGIDSVIIDGGTPISLTPVGCLTGSAQIFTMTFSDDNNITYLSATFSAQPTVAGNYNIKFTQPAATTDVQLKISQTGLNGSYFTAQTAGTAALSFNGGKLQLSFSNITFLHSGSTSKVVSSTILCN